MSGPMDPEAGRLARAEEDLRHQLIRVRAMIERSERKADAAQRAITYGARPPSEADRVFGELRKVVVGRLGDAGDGMDIVSDIDAALAELQHLRRRLTEAQCSKT